MPSCPQWGSITFCIHQHVLHCTALHQLPPSHPSRHPLSLPCPALPCLASHPQWEPTQVSSARLKSGLLKQGKARQGKTGKKCVHHLNMTTPSIALSMARIGQHCCSVQQRGGGPHQLCPVQQSASRTHALALAHIIHHAVAHRGQVPGPAEMRERFREMR